MALERCSLKRRATASARRPPTRSPTRAAAGLAGPTPAAPAPRCSPPLQFFSFFSLPLSSSFFLRRSPFSSPGSCHGGFLPSSLLGFSAASSCSSFSSSAPVFSEFVGSQPLCNERVARDVGIVFSSVRRWRHLANCSTHRGSSSRFASGTNCNLHSLRRWGFSCAVFQRT